MHIDFLHEVGYCFTLLALQCYYYLCKLTHAELSISELSHFITCSNKLLPITLTWTVGQGVSFHHISFLLYIQYDLYRPYRPMILLLHSTLLLLARQLSALITIVASVLSLPTPYQILSWVIGRILLYLLPILLV